MSYKIIFSVPGLVTRVGGGGLFDANGCGEARLRNRSVSMRSDLSESLIVSILSVMSGLTLMTQDFSVKTFLVLNQIN